jgi:hypothetical protein
LACWVAMQRQMQLWEQIHSQRGAGEACSDRGNSFSFLCFTQGVDGGVAEDVVAVISHVSYSGELAGKVSGRAR